MSTQTTTYVMAGVMLPYNYFSEGAYEALEVYRDSAFCGPQHHNGLCVVADYLNGAYVAAGRVLLKSRDPECDYGIPAPFDATSALTRELKEEVADLLEKHLGIGDPDVRVWCFTHYR